MTQPVLLHRREPGDAAALFKAMGDPVAMRWWPHATFAAVDDLAACFHRIPRLLAE